MKIFLCALAFAVLSLSGGAVAADSSASCPSDVNSDDPAWVLRSIKGGNSLGGEEYAYETWMRVFAYQPDAMKRYRKEFFPECFAETYSFVVGGTQKEVAKRVVSSSGVRAFLLLSDNTWREGSEVRVAADFASLIDPAYYVFLLRASTIVAHRKIPVFIIVPSLSFQDD